jgi:hypothetical protein
LGLYNSISKPGQCQNVVCNSRKTRTSIKKLNELKKYLNQPYPFYYKGKKLIQISLVIFFLAFFFNYVIQPFGIDTAELKLDYFWVALIHSVSPLFLLIPLSFAFAAMNQSIENWKLKYEFLFIISFLLLTGILQFLLRDILYTTPFNWSLMYLKEELINTFLIGSVLAFLVVSANLNIQFYKNSEQASALNVKLTDTEPLLSQTQLFIDTELKSESFHLDIQNFVFAKSQGNYVEVWIVDNSFIKPILKRIKLKDLETVLLPYNNIIKTHRSYLLNKDFIGNVSGNAQGYKIQLKNCKELIPVSRNYLEAFNTKMQA